MPFLRKLETCLRFAFSAWTRTSYRVSKANPRWCRARDAVHPIFCWGGWWRLWIDELIDWLIDWLSNWPIDRLTNDDGDQLNGGVMYCFFLKSMCLFIHSCLFINSSAFAKKSWPTYCASQQNFKLYTFFFFQQLAKFSIIGRSATRFSFTLDHFTSHEKVQQGSTSPYTHTRPILVHTLQPTQTRCVLRNNPCSVWPAGNNSAALACNAVRDNQALEFAEFFHSFILKSKHI